MKSLLMQLLVAAAMVSSLVMVSPKAQAYGSYGGGGFGGDSGWEIEPSLMYYFYTQNFGSSTNTTYNRTLGSLGVGYHWSQLYLGGIYSYDQFQTVGGGSNTSTDNYGSYGVTVGLETDGLFLDATYFIGSTANLYQGTTNAVTYNSGSGFQVALGYLFQVGSGWSVGPELDYRSLSYPTQPPKGTYTFTTLAPYLSFHYKF